MMSNLSDAQAHAIVEFVCEHMEIVRPQISGQHWWRLQESTLRGVGPNALEALLASLPKERTHESDVQEVQAQQS